MIQYWLKEDITLVPLIGRWYAWPHLIAPLTGALNIAKRHLPIMDSYANAPALHARAVQDINNIGGPFVDYETDCSSPIRALASKTRSECRGLLEVAIEVEKLREMLRTAPDDATMESLYSTVPDGLKGYVELIRETEGKPGFRLIEELLYRSPYYVKNLQSISIQTERANPRPFSLSTPTLDDSNNRILDIAFDDPRLDRLAMARIHPVDAPALLQELGLPSDDLASLFTTQAPPRPDAVVGSKVRVLGHATVLIEHAGTSILVDPVIGYASARQDGGWTFSDLPDQIDAIVITHSHQDHFFLETLLQLRSRTQCVIVPQAARGELTDPSPAIMLRQLGFTDVREAPYLEPLKIGSATVTALPFLGEHGDLPIGAKATYAVNVEGENILLMADFRNIEPRVVAHLAKILPAVDTLFIGMECEGAPVSWLYGPLLSKPLPRNVDNARHLSSSDCAQAISLIDLFNPKRAFVYAMGQERWLRHITSKIYTDTSLPIVEASRFVRICTERGMEAKLLLGPYTLSSKKNSSRLHEECTDH